MLPCSTVTAQNKGIRRLTFLTAPHRSVKGYKGTTSIDLGVTNKFQGVRKSLSTESKNNEARLYLPQKPRGLQHPKYLPCGPLQKRVPVPAVQCSRPSCKESGTGTKGLARAWQCPNQRELLKSSRLTSYGGRKLGAHAWLSKLEDKSPISSRLRASGFRSTSVYPVPSNSPGLYWVMWAIQSS